MMRIQEIKESYGCKLDERFGFGFEYQRFQKCFKCKCGRKFVSLKMMEYHQSDCVVNLKK